MHVDYMGEKQQKPRGKVNDAQCSFAVCLLSPDLCAALPYMHALLRMKDETSDFE